MQTNVDSFFTYDYNPLHISIIAKGHVKLIFILKIFKKIFPENTTNLLPGENVA